MNIMRRPSRRLVVSLLALLVLGIAGGTLATGLWRPLADGLDYPLSYIRVQGELRNLDRDKLQQALLPAVTSGYFSVDIREIERVLNAFPWVAEVQVARQWPDTLELKIVEQQAVARWGGKALLNDRGEKFASEDLDRFLGLPLIVGPAGMEADLLVRLRSLNQTLENTGLSIASLDLSQRRAWVVKLNSGMEIHFGRRDPDLALAHFLALLPKLGENKLAQMQRVDLRYPNGFSVIWKPEVIQPGDASRDSMLGFRFVGKATELALGNI